jgi:DNA-binding beta-propeller fold protein YncE/mono/diheme cytochrome c family protein
MRLLRWLVFFGLYSGGLYAQDWCAPAAIALARGTRTLYIGCARAPRIEVFELATNSVTRQIPTPSPVSGIALSADEKRLFITCTGDGTVRIVEGNAITGSIITGHPGVSPKPSADGRWLYVANQFVNRILVLDVTARNAAALLTASREPISVDLSRDGKQLLVANALPAGRADRPPVAAEIEFIETTSKQVSARIVLPNGSTGLRQIRVSPDGRIAAVSHLLSRYFVPTTQADRGWIQTNAVSLLDVAARTRIATVLLDDLDRGAANPWAVEWSADGKYLCVTHAGTHELSILDYEALRGKLAKTASDPANDLSFLAGIRKRVQLSGKGPRSMAVSGHRTWIAGFFSDSLEEVDLDTGAVTCLRAPRLHAAGESLFNDGSISFQGWMSCASCHGPEGRVDGLNWDLLNDGIGDPINTKSLLLAHRTPPAMSHFVRENAEVAVRAGLEHILFSERPESEAAAIDEFLKSLKPMPSPHLLNGQLSASALRGKKLFFSRRVGCGSCHPAGLFTTLKSYDVGAGKLDTPTLVESWRTAPYLHDGSAATLREVLTTANPQDRHGKTSQLTKAQIDDLLAYLLTL